MSDEEIEKLMKEYEPFIVNDEGDVDMGALRLLCKEIEREIRSHCRKLAFEAANSM